METRIKYIIGIIGGLVVIVTGCITIWKFFQPDYKLEAIVYVTEVEFPHKVAMDIKQLSELPLEEMQKDENLKSIKSTKFEEIARAQPVFKEFLAKKINKILDDSLFGLPKRLTVAVVRNSGKNTLHEVEIKGSIGGINYAQIQRDGGKTEVQEFTNKVTIGEMSPISEIKVCIWSNYFSLFDSPLSVISHRDGIGEIIFYPPPIPLAINYNTRSINISYNSVTLILLVIVIIISLVLVRTLLKKRHINSPQPGPEDKVL